MMPSNTAYIAGACSLNMYYKLSLGHSVMHIGLPAPNPGTHPTKFSHKKESH